MNNLEQLQLFLTQTHLKYERYTKRFGYYSLKTRKITHQLEILLQLHNEYFTYQAQRKKHSS
ncbi:hypothetical protein SAMN06296056_1021169 [Priestia filamentosa]|nr:hypothetical protein B1B01_12945 [Priestia filamentosa]SMF37194.1 hypothetical protein SAMN06296056_1021169 [Priestia filamentosa]